MKLIMGMVLVIGLATVAASGLAYASAIAKSTTIICEITQLHESNPANLEQFQSMASAKLRTIQDSFVPLMYLGGFTALLGLVGLIVSARKRDDKSGQPTAAASPSVGK